ncbi:MAG: SPOR domain-containing protein, partial [Desulfatitalea sp.]|nr:SPOR domain-containing protein [Desulfatitalea sp.]NNJ99191.1 SPOR domain-containing protein [Desulfatitalea sp.]
APDTDVQEQADDAQEDESQARFTIQMGAFRNESFANKAMADMQQRGYPAYVHQYSDEDQRPFYLVRFGRFYTLDDASAAMDDFKDREQMPAVIARIGEK